MQFHPDIAPAMRNTREKNHDLLAQARLGARNPAGPEDWNARYAESFTQLYKIDDTFRDLVNEALTEDCLVRIQQRLDD